MKSWYLFLKFFMNILRKKIKCSNYGHSIHPFVHFCDMMSNFTSLRQVFFPLNFKIWGNLRYIKCFCFNMGSSLCPFLSITYVHFYVACWCLINRLLSLIIGCLKVKWKKFYSTVFPKGNWSINTSCTEYNFKFTFGELQKVAEILAICSPPLFTTSIHLYS